MLGICMAFYKKKAKSAETASSFISINNYLF